MILKNINKLVYFNIFKMIKIKFLLNDYIMNIKNDLFEFELEFCLTKNAYMEAYDEDDTLWDLNHNEMMELFHKIFIYNEEQCHIIEDIVSFL